MRLLLPLCLASVLALAGTDTDADGRPDWSGPALFDADNDGSYDGPGAPAAPAMLSDSVSFSQTWTSGSVLNNQWDADCGYLDGDSLLDILGSHWNPNQLHVFESDGTGGYDHVWTQTESLPPGSYAALCHGDPDEDGQVEILGGDVSTLGKVVLFENVADDSWALPRVLFRTRLFVRAIRISDTNGNDTAEIVLICGNSDGGKVQIYEHDGGPGIHSYRLLHEYTTVSYVFNGGVGDADNDGRAEVLIGCGGWHGFPMNIRRIVYDPGARTYSHRLYQSEVVGLFLSPMACDIDSNGANELVVGSSGDPNGQVHVFKYTGNDSFSHVWTAVAPTAGNAITVQAGLLEGFGTPVFLAGMFGGAAHGYVHNDSTFHGICDLNPGTGAAVRSIDVACDIRDQLILAESAPSDFVSVWRRDPAQAVAGGPQRPVAVRPAPVISGSVLHLPAGPAVLVDAAGRAAAALRAGANDVGRLPAGVYFVRAGQSAAGRVVLLR